MGNNQSSVLQKAHEKSCLQLLGVFSSALSTNDQHSRSWKNLTLKITECHYLLAKRRKHRAPSSARKNQKRGSTFKELLCTENIGKNVYIVGVH